MKRKKVTPDTYPIFNWIHSNHGTCWVKKGEILASIKENSRGRFTFNLWSDASFPTEQQAAEFVEDIFCLLIDHGMISPGQSSYPNRAAVLPRGPGRTKARAR